MLTIKRQKLEMPVDDPIPARKRSLQAELELMKGEVEQVEHRRSSSSSSSKTETVSYRPTYRAVLARKGYLVRQTLGTGSYSKVKFARSFDHDREKVAVKIVDKGKAPKDFQQRFLPREVAIWPRLKHPHIIQNLEIFEDNRRLYMILEYAENGDVLRYIQRSGAVSENRAGYWTRQIGDAVRYLHEINITHRDLKLENLLLDHENNIKICDFGFVKEETSQELSRTYCGSKSYAAPEILKGQPYDTRKADIWAIGVILYILVTGKMPFDESKGNRGVLEEQRNLNFPWQKFKKPVSEECQSLILWMFRYDYNDRPDIYGLLHHSWLAENCSAPPLECPKREVSTGHVTRKSSRPTPVSTQTTDSQ
ncbi:testis-specific serine/threonine-protein kinase 3-like [Argopecten irradians]|uniref:testis-specific serine/threonine-protein kinase 3-like n=1 Tax=Argopecten irradians TaxID=31199 RepID=UPI00371C84C7